MPRPGSPQQPRFQRGDSLAYGEATAANDMADMAPEMPMVMDDQEFMPSTPEEQFLYAQTDKPDEPITAGAPFGAGPGVRRQTDQSLMRTVFNAVSSLAAADPNPELQGFLKKLQAGL